MLKCVYMDIGPVLPLHLFCHLAMRFILNLLVITGTEGCNLHRHTCGEFAF